VSDELADQVILVLEILWEQWYKEHGKPAPEDPLANIGKKKKPDDKKKRKFPELDRVYEDDSDDY